jgi:hypothetical protein
MNRHIATGLAASSILLFVLTGCPGSGGSSSGTGGGGGVCSDYFNALIAYSDRCQGTTGSIESVRGRFEDICGKALGAPGASNLSGQIASCSSTISTLTCGEDLDCVEGAGEFADGTACGEGYQCKSSFCKKADSEATCGTCAARVAIDAPCAGGSSNECVENARCVTSSSTGGACRAIKLAKAGEPCSSSTGTEVVECDKGLNCFFTPGGATGASSPVCRAPAGDGQDCSSRSDCTTGLTCVKNKCGQPLAEGAACESISGSECAKGFGCDKTCKRIVKVKAGEECDLVRQCERGNCRGQSFTSGPTGTTFTPGKCTDPLPDGAACTKRGADDKEPPASCDVFAECIAGKCTVPDPASCK